MTEIKKTTTIKKGTTIKLPKTDTTKKTVVKKEVVKKVLTLKTEDKVSPKILNKTEPKIVAKKVAKSTVKKDSNITYATGKRKNAIAKVWLRKGTGNITVNKKSAEDYLQRAILNVIINQPFEKTDTKDKFDIECTVLGGGLSGQAGAIKHGISIALQLLNPELRAVLKSAGFLTRDSRVVERKKPGLKKARKGQVYQKR